MNRIVVLGVSLAIFGCATPPQEPLHQGVFGPIQSLTGELRFGFERQSFDACWLDLSESAMAELARLAPSPALNDERAPYSAFATLAGRRRNLVNMTRNGPEGQGFGHLGSYPCLIEASQVTAARLP